MRGGVVKLTNLCVIDIDLQKPNDILDSFRLALRLEKIHK